MNTVAENADVTATADTILQAENTDVKPAKPAAHKKMFDLDSSIISLQKKLSQARALKAQTEAKIKYEERKITRQNADRQKYLIGAYILSQVKDTPDRQKDLFIKIQSYLTRESDKNLFA